MTNSPPSCIPWSYDLSLLATYSITWKHITWLGNTLYICHLGTTSHWNAKHDV